MDAFLRAVFDPFVHVLHTMNISILSITQDEVMPRPVFMTSMAGNTSNGTYSILDLRHYIRSWLLRRAHLMVAGKGRESILQ